MERIEDRVFESSNRLKVLRLPSNLKYFSPNAVHWNKLESFSISSENKVYSCVDGLLLSADGSKLIRVPPGLTSLNIPLSVRVIGDQSLQGCNMESLYFPGTVNVLGHLCLACCYDLRRVEFEGWPTLYDHYENLSGVTFVVNDLEQWREIKDAWSLGNSCTYEVRED